MQIHVTTVCLALILLCNVWCRDAIQYFITHSKVKRTSIRVLENVDNSTKKWIEYQYFFKIDKEEPAILNKSLRIGVFMNSSMDYDFTGCHLGKNITGYDVDVIEYLQGTLNISTEFILVENLTDLIIGEVDLVICHTSLQNILADVVELHPIIKTNLLLIYKPAKLHFIKDIFILTFAGSLWVVFFAVMILLAVCLRISTKRYSRIKTKYEPFTWVEITLWAVAAACQQGLSRTPTGFASCLIFFLGYLMAYLLYTGFAAGITSILVENVETNVELSRLRLDRLHLVTPKCTQYHLKHFKRQFLVTEVVSDIKVLFEYLERDNRIGVGPEISVQQYMATNFNFDQTLSYESMKLEIPFTKGFLVHRHHPWGKIINKHIVSLDESGVLENILKRNLRPAPKLNLKSGYSSAGQEHVNSAILLFLGGLSVAFLFFVSEFILYLYQRGGKQTINKN